MLKKILRIGAYMMGGLLIALILLPFVFEKEIKEGLKKALNDSLYANVDFNDISLSLIRNFPKARLTIHELKVDGIDTFSNIPLLHAEKTIVEFGLLSLFKKNTPYTIHKVTIDRPYLNLIILDDASTANYLIAQEEESEVEYTIQLDQYRIRNGSLHFKSYANGLALHAENISHQGKGAFTQDIFDLVTKTHSSELSVTYGGLPILHRIDAHWDAVLHIDLPASTYTFKESTLLLNELPVQLDGFVTVLEQSMVMDLKIESREAQFSKIFSIVPYVYTDDFKDASISGEGNISAFINGVYNDENGQYPHFNFKVNVNDGEVRYKSLPRQIKDIFINAEIGNLPANPLKMKADIPFFRFRMDQDYFDGRFLFIGSAEDGQVDMGIRANVELKNWQEAFPMEPGTEIKGKLHSDLILKSTLADIEKQNFKNIVFKGNVNIQDFLWRVKHQSDIRLQNFQLTAAPDKAEISIQGLAHPAFDLNAKAEWYHPLQWMAENGIIHLKGQLESQKINLNTLATTESQETASSTSSFEKGMIFPDLDIALDAKINELNSGSYTLNYVTFSGNLKNDVFTLNEASMMHADSDIKIKGSINGWQSWLTNDGVLHGQLDISSSKLDLNPFLIDNTAPSGEEVHFEIPGNLDLKLTAGIDELKYSNFAIKGLHGRLDIEESTAYLSNLEGNVLGGKFQFEGMYSTQNTTQPAFNVKMDLSTIGFKESFNAFNTMQALAPVSQYIDGLFNTTLVLEGQLNEKMMPVLPTLNASGYLETLNGRISGIPPMERLAQSLGVNKVANWTIQNTRNWFEVVNGMVELKEKTFDLGENVTLGIRGKHGLGRELDYYFQVALPRDYLRKNPVTGALEAGLSQLEKEAVRYGIQIDQGEYLIVDIKMTGSMSNPQFKITPSGKSKVKIDDAIKSELANKEAELRDIAEATQKKVIDTLEKARDKMLDSLQAMGNQKVKEVRDSLERLIEKERQAILDSLKKKTGFDQIGVPSLDSLQLKKPKEVEDIKDKIQQWNPLRKKSGGG